MIKIVSKNYMKSTNEFHRRLCWNLLGGISPIPNLLGGKTSPCSGAPVSNSTAAPVLHFGLDIKMVEWTHHLGLISDLSEETK